MHELPVLKEAPAERNEQSNIVLNMYINITQRLGGVAAVVVQNLDAPDGDPKQGFAFYGPPPLLETAAQQLQNQAKSLTETAFARWLGWTPLFKKP